MYKSRMVYQRMKRPCCQVSMPLLLHQFSRVMHPALSKKIVHGTTLSVSENITPLNIFLYSAELASVPKHWPMLLAFVSEHYTVHQRTQSWAVFGTGGSLSA